MDVEEAHEGRRASRVRLIAAALLLLFSGGIVREMVSPFDDWVPLVPPASLPAGVALDDLPQSAHHRCSAPFGGGDEASVTDQATTALTVQALSREPCEARWPERRVLGVVNVLFVAGLASALGLRWLARRRTTA